MLNKVILIFVGVIFCLSAKSQDRLFSQFYASPMTLNPALTGAFEGRYRVSAIYRDQWRGVMENPYATFSSALDLRWKMGKNAAKTQDHAAIGLLFYNDKAGAVDFSTTQISVSGAFHKALDARGTQFLSLGIQAGIAQRNVNYGDLTFEDQFNGTTGYSDQTNEDLPENNYSFADYSVGLNYVYAPKYSRFKVFAGAAMHHFASPSVSFYRHSDPESDYPDNELDRRYSMQLSAIVPVSQGLQFLPRAIFDSQGSHAKLDAGGNFRISASQQRNLAVHLGAYVRPVTDYDDTYRLDALIGLVGFEFSNVLVGLSYDLNLGDSANFSRRTFEISVAYLGEYEDEVVLCPKF